MYTHKHTDTELHDMNLYNLIIYNQKQQENIDIENQTKKHLKIIFHCPQNTNHNNKTLENTHTPRHTWTYENTSRITEPNTLFG